MENKRQNIDAVLFSIPPILLRGPHLAPALLKSYAQSKGFKVRCMNPSLDLFTSLPDSEKDNWPYNDFEKFYSDKNGLLESTIDQWIDEIMLLKPRIVGLSTHAWSSMFFLTKIAGRLKKRHPDQIIALGGPPVMEAGQSLLQAKLIDYFVSGDGEDAFISLLDGTFDHPNINSTKPVGISNEQFNNLPLPDFSDSEFERLKARDPKNNRIYLIGSRGCVFNCSFCNVPSMTSKFRYKNGTKFANEVFAIQKQYEPAFIELADSILNGSMSTYREFIQALVERKNETGIQPQLDAFFRCRPKHVMSPEDFKLSAEAGMKRFRIGVESGSYEVRKHMGKKETNEDILYTLEECLKNNIGVNLLLIAGYVNETEERFLETMNFLQEIRRRDLDLTIDTVVVNELYISEFTPLREQVDQLNIKNLGTEIAEKSERFWNREMEDGTINNSTLRMQRVRTLKKFAQENFRALGKILVFSSDEDSWTSSSQNPEAQKSG